MMAAEREAEAPPEAPTTTKRGTRRWLVGVPLAWFIGAVLCTSFAGGLVANGFLYRWMARASHRVWWREGGQTEPFEHDRPRWLMSGATGWRGWLGGLTQNVSVGVSGAFQSFMALIPSAALWMFAWRYGWDNSFTKGYDLRWIGPTLGLLGTALFVGTMWLLPLAQARHATTRSWRAFWDVGMLATLAKTRWIDAVPVAAAYALLGIPFTWMWMIPVFAPTNNDAFASMSPEELRGWLDGYYFVWAVLGFAATFWLKWLGARWYARALLGAVRGGAITRRQLHPVEAAHFDAGGLLAVRDLSHRHPLVRAADWTASTLGRATVVVVASALWGLVAFQLFVGLFFHYRPVVGWTNQPLILVPVFKYVPPGLRP